MWFLGKVTSLWTLEKAKGENKETGFMAKVIS